MAKEYTAKTVEDAIKLGLEDLGITEDQAEYTVVDLPTKGLFGIGSKPAKVAMSKKKTDANSAAKFLDGLFEILNIKATTDIVEDSEEKIVINLITTDSSILIGYRGEVLDSLQCLAGAVANKSNEDYKRVVVDCEGYRSKREETLKNLAVKLAENAVATGRKKTLEPMNPFERRIIHSALIDAAGVKTISEGKEPNRYIVIIPDNYDPSKEERRPRSFGDRGSRGGYRGGNGERREGGERRDGGRNFGDRGSRGGYRGGNGEKREGGERRDGGRNFGDRGARGGYRGGNGERRDGGFRPQAKKNFGGGVFLGNSLKNGEETKPVENSTENKD